MCIRDPWPSLKKASSIACMLIPVNSPQGFILCYVHNGKKGVGEDWNLSGLCLRVSQLKSLNKGTCIPCKQPLIQGCTRSKVCSRAAFFLQLGGRLNWWLIISTLIQCLQIWRLNNEINYKHGAYFILFGAICLQIKVWMMSWNLIWKMGNKTGQFSPKYMTISNIIGQPRAVILFIDWKQHVDAILVGYQAEIKILIASRDTIGILVFLQLMLDIYWKNTRYICLLSY